MREAAVLFCSLSLLLLRVNSFVVPPRQRQGRFSLKPFLVDNRIRVPSTKESTVDDGNDREEPPETDFPSWVQALGRWPLIPDLPPDNENDSTNPDSSTAETDQEEASLQLESLINVEAILLASNNNNITGQEDTKRKLSVTEPSVFPFVQTLPLSFIPEFDELGNWNKLVGNLRQSIGDVAPGTLQTSTDQILKEATSRIESFLGEGSKIVSPLALERISQMASTALNQSKTLEVATKNVVEIADTLARERGLDLGETADRARETTTDVLDLANRLMLAGFATSGDLDTSQTQTDFSRKEQLVFQPLFSGFASARLASSKDFKTVVGKASEYVSLSGGIYEETKKALDECGHSLVAQGTTSEVSWIITDSIGSDAEFDSYGSSEPFLVRTITIRGFDSSDELVDREKVLIDICNATQEILTDKVLVHSGLMKIARSILFDIDDYISSVAPNHRIVLNGHSVGGSLSILLLFLITMQRGAEFTIQKILRVYTFGSPPVAVVSIGEEGGTNSISSLAVGEKREDTIYKCKILEAFGLPPSMVHSYIQPWDPIVRLFSPIDPLYPLLGDLGEDGVTVYASGPRRSLRPLTRQIFQSWDGWPRFRDNFVAAAKQNFTAVGTQHLLLPDRLRYLSDKLAAMDVQVPEVDSVLTISSEEVYPSLTEVFPLSTFSVSFVPAALRSFIHHFYPAYVFPLVTFAKKVKKRDQVESKRR